MNSKTALVIANSIAAAACICLFVLIFNLTGTNKTGVATSGLSSTSEIAAPLQRALEARGDNHSPLAQVYQARNYSPIWFAKGGLTADARATISVLEKAGNEGLSSSRYGLGPQANARSDANVKAAFELSLTDAVLKYASDMRWGAIRPDTLFTDVNLPRDAEDIVHDVSTAANRGNAHALLRALEPPVRGYALLRESLARYRATAARGGWPSVTAETKLSPANLIRLQTRLQAEGYLAQSALPVPATSVVTALKAYQADSGLTADGRMNERTAAMLNVPAAARADQIAANMERWRWLPHDLGQQFIMVNVPDASLSVVDSGVSSLLSRVVVGAPDKPTPILATKAVAVTINPAWHVPKSIVEKEIKPKLASNPNYLEEKNMISDNGEVIQKPGPGNALGVAKFEMPNPFDVYMHDTPAKNAFLSDERTLSHGCVRVEAIRPLVEKVLNMEDDRLQELISTGDTLRQPLKQAIPVYIQYWTAIARDDHRMAFREDVYGRDARMISVMFPREGSVIVASGH
jgi:murein L,D-transpeptidase YcbB/YkuD